MMKKWLLVFKSSTLLLLIMVLQDVTIVLAKPAIPTTTATTAATVITQPTEVSATKKATTTVVDKLQPLYEYQLAVWPTDVDDIIEAVMPQNDEMPIHTLIEQPVVVMPDMDYDDTQISGSVNDGGDDDDDDDDDHDVVYDPNSDLWPTIIGGEDVTVKPDPVIVLENYHNKYGNGSEEYKLVLSNGMVNYQRIDHVLVKGVRKPIQHGYYTVPTQHSTRESYQTTYFRADKSGYHVYKTVQSARNPAYDIYLQYKKDQNNKVDENNKTDKK